MKVLFYCGYVYRKDLPEFRKNRTGFGILLDQIATHVHALNDEVHVVTNAFTRGHDLGYKIPRHTFIDFLLHLRLDGIFHCLDAFRGEKLRFKEKLRYMYYYMNTGYIRHYIKKFKPELVHIHGLLYNDYCVAELCEKMGQPYVITAHGLVEATESLSAAQKEIERKIFREAEERGTPVSVISTGIKRRLTEAYYGLKAADNVTVITNGTDVTPKEATRDIRTEHGIPADGKICLSVGSVMDRKNQMQIVRAYTLLPPGLKERTYVLLAGTVAPNYPIAEEIERLGIGGHVKLLGFVDHADLCNYYSAADAVVLASKDEGFGISLIESFVYGKPSVFFSDIDPAVDLVNEMATVVSKGREDSDLAAALEKALTTEWDAERIRDYSKNFSLEDMAKKYHRFYERALSEK